MPSDSSQGGPGPWRGRRWASLRSLVDQPIGFPGTKDVLVIAIGMIVRGAEADLHDAGTPSH